LTNADAILLASGFERVAVDRFNIEWKSDRTEAPLELICGSALRAAMLIEAQAKIHNAIILASRVNSAAIPSSSAGLPSWRLGKGL